MDGYMKTASITFDATEYVLFSMASGTYTMSSFLCFFDYIWENFLEDPQNM